MNPVILERITQCNALPCLPQVAVELLRLIREDHAQGEEIAWVVEHDPALVARLLRMVNSPLYGLRTEISSVSHAVVLLGIAAVRAIALSFSITKGLGSESRDPFRRRYWKRAVIAGVAGREIAANLTSVDKEVAFLGSLLQDIGVLVLSTILPRDQVFTLGEAQRHLDQVRLERARLGTDHVEVGAYFAERWNFPRDLTSAVRWHHDPDACDEPEHRELVRVVAVSDLLAEALRGRAREAALIDARVRAGLFWGTVDDEFADMLDWIGVSLPEITAFFEIDVGGESGMREAREEARRRLREMPLASILDTALDRTEARRRAA
jgi:HD-like signal output (HDOD) protein